MASKFYSSQGIADLFGVPIETVRRIIDRLGLGGRVGQNRVVFAEDLPALRVAFLSHGYPVPEADSLQPVAAPPQEEEGP
jgi:hypothetical protein